MPTARTAMAFHLMWLGRLRGHGGCGLRHGGERDLALRAGGEGHSLLVPPSSPGCPFAHAVGADRPVRRACTSTASVPRTWPPSSPSGTDGRPVRLMVTWPGAVLPTPRPRVFAR